MIFLNYKKKIINHHIRLEIAFRESQMTKTIKLSIIVISQAVFSGQDSTPYYVKRLLQTVNDIEKHHFECDEFDLTPGVPKY